MGELLIDAAGALRAAPRQPRRRIVRGRGFSAGVLRGHTADERVALGYGRPHVR